MVFALLINFRWRWVSFLYSDDDYGNDGLELFLNKIKGTDICLAYSKGLSENTNYPQTLQQLDEQRVNVIIVFAPEWTAEALVKAAITENITNKVWIAGDAWSLNKQLPKAEGIRNIGTVLGVAEPFLTIPGFSEFIDYSKSKSQQENANQGEFCNQNCNCSNVSADDINNADPSFNFPVYSAVYAIAHALHTALQCDDAWCDRNITVDTYTVSPLIITSDQLIYCGLCF